MPKPDIVRLRHMHDACREILKFTSGKEREDLDSNRVLTLAVIRLLEIIGEAAAGLSKEFRDAHPTIPWNDIVAMRHRLIHGYFDVDLNIVWNTIDVDIPGITTELESILELDR